MRRFVKYLKYVLKHKWFVMVAGRKIGASFWLTLIHDASKFLPSEWLPYSRTFYKPDGSKQYVETPEFNMAWLIHQHRNPHHWQYWLLKEDSGKLVPLPMPEKYALEMIADWLGASKVKTGKMECASWYEENKRNMVLHKNTQDLIESIILTEELE